MSRLIPPPPPYLLLIYFNLLRIVSPEEIRLELPHPHYTHILNTNKRRWVSLQQARMRTLNVHGGLKNL